MIRTLAVFEKKAGNFLKKLLDAAMPGGTEKSNCPGSVCAAVERVGESGRGRERRGLSQGRLWRHLVMHKIL